jgi:hypothetical protein
MSRKIARLLDESPEKLGQLLKELEEKNGLPSHDARFLAQTVQQVRSKIADLGLDPDDTTGEELYHALQVRFQKNSHLFDVYFDAMDLGFEDRAAMAAQLVSRNFEAAERWALKSPAAKQLLKDLPPKQVMKHLGYRSLDSMLKREKIAELYLAAAYVEADSWHKNHQKLVSKLDQTAFELRIPAIISLDYDKWSAYEGPDNFVAVDDDMAVLAVWPSADTRNASLLSQCLMLMENLQLDERHKLAHKLSRISGVLDWWADADHLLGELDGEPVSFSLKDAALNSLHGNDYSDRELTHARKGFWQELVSRYEKLPPSEALFDDTVRQKIAKLKFKPPEPVYEFAEEDLDG